MLKGTTEDKSSILRNIDFKLAYYYTIQIGAYKTQMNDKLMIKLMMFGDQFQIFHDRNLKWMGMY